MWNAARPYREELLACFQSALSRDCNNILRTTRRNDPVLEFAHSVAHGLERQPRRMECRFLYDAHGSELYEQICAQPEYYPTRTEAAILARCASEIRAITGPVTLLELGSGSSVKTDHLLRAYLACDASACYVPIDVSESALRQASRTITANRPNVRVISIHGTYQDALPLFTETSPAMVLFLGSTIGNLDEDEAARFWKWIAAHMNPGDFFLLGVDLVKDEKLLEAAYNDAAGVTANFTRNLFARMNRELGSDIDLAGVEHQAFYNDQLQQIEIHAGFTKPQDIFIAPLGRNFSIGKGERLLVEISRKFRLDQLSSFLEPFGFTVRKVFTDERQWFAVLLLQRSRDHAPTSI